MSCEPLNRTITPSGRIASCVTCGAPLTLEMEFDFPYVCVECQRDMAETHSSLPERPADMAKKKQNSPAAPNPDSQAQAPIPGPAPSAEEIRRLHVETNARDRFQGSAPEPRPGLPSGHMPGAFNTPHSELVQRGALQSRNRLQDLLKAEGVDLNKPIITTCGSGVSAAIIALALARLGKWDAPVYDGSWTEWAGRKDAAIATGR